MSMKVSYTIKMFIFSLVTLAVSAASLLFIWFYSAAEGMSLKNSMQAVRDRETIAREYQQLQTVLNRTEDERGRLHQYILEGENGAINFLSMIDEIAVELGIVLKTERLDVQETKEAGFDILEAGFSISGEERAVMKMVQLLEFVPYHSHINSLTLTRSKEPTTNQEKTHGSVVIHVSIVEE